MMFLLCTCVLTTNWKQSILSSQEDGENKEGCSYPMNSGEMRTEDDNGCEDPVRRENMVMMEIERPGGRGMKATPVVCCTFTH